ncbi:MAG: protein-export chaperone SecB [Caulobacteraceae bacterium]|nr:protein-export chaperone SecB [Caulobacteraceae bacterium]
MTDAAAGQPETPMDAGPAMRVLTQFVRDFSFENPRAPESLRMDGRPEVDMGVEMNAKGRADGLFEVDMKLSVKASTEQGPMFAIELIYGGLFQISGIPEDQLETVLLVECPRYMFPFARQIIASATADGGFYPPFLLEPIDFAAIYQARKDGAAEPPPLNA